MSTAANIRSSEGSHWYSSTGVPMYEMPKKDGSGMRATTLADAKKLNLLPSVTTVLKVLHKPALEAWKIEQACLALMTTPRLENEPDDLFVYRVLNIEKAQDQEGQIARDRGTELHAALEDLFSGRQVSDDVRQWVMPAYTKITARAGQATCERVMVGDGYAGKCDLIYETPLVTYLYDFKTTKSKKLPTKSYPDHVLQLAAYAAAHRVSHPVVTANVYISTVTPGLFTICEHGREWERAYVEGLKPLLTYWQYSNDYKPLLPLASL